MPLCMLANRSSGLFIAIYQVMKNRSQNIDHYVFCRGEKCIASEKEERQRERRRERRKSGKKRCVCVFTVQLCLHRGEGVYCLDMK